MKVSELAERAGTTAKTIRFYEAEGVLPLPARSENGYREYSDDDICRVRIVVALRRLGLEPDESGRLASMCVGGDCDGMAQQLVVRIARRRMDVAAARAELDHLEAELAGLERALASGASTDHLCTGKEESRDVVLRVRTVPARYSLPLSPLTGER